MRAYEPRIADSPQDIAAQANRFGRAVIGQIHRLRSVESREVADLAVDAWEKIATRDYIVELATRTMVDASAVKIVDRLRRDVVLYLNDCALMDRAAGKTIGAARELVVGAIRLVLRHA